MKEEKSQGAIRRIMNPVSRSTQAREGAMENMKAGKVVARRIGRVLWIRGHRAELPRVHMPSQLFAH